MPAKRLDWFRVWIDATTHEKVRQLDDATFRTWVELLDAAAKQPRRGRFVSRASAASIIRRPVKHVATLIAATLIDESDEGLTMHDWDEWQRWRPQDTIDDATPPDRPPNGYPNNSRTTTEHHANGHSLRVPARAPASGDTETERDTDVDTPPTGPPRLRVLGEPVPKPTHKPIDDDYVAELVSQFAPQLGGEAHVRLRIDTALNHRQFTKAIDKRKYLRNWLRGDVEFAAADRGRAAAGGARPYRQPVDDPDLPF